VSGNNEVELKGGMYAFISLKLYVSDLDAIDQHVADKVQQAPSFFKGTPVVVDFTPLEEQLDKNPQQELDLDPAKLFDRIRAHNLIPIVASVSDKSSALARSIGLPLIERSAKQTATSSTTDSSANKSADAAGAGEAVSAVTRGGRCQSAASD